MRTKEILENLIKQQDELKESIADLKKDIYLLNNPYKFGIGQKVIFTDNELEVFILNREIRMHAVYDGFKYIPDTFYTITHNRFEKPLWVSEKYLKPII